MKLYTRFTKLYIFPIDNYCYKIVLGDGELSSDQRKELLAMAVNFVNSCKDVKDDDFKSKDNVCRKNSNVCLLFLFTLFRQILSFLKAYFMAFVFDSGVLQRSPLQHHWSHFEVGGLAWKRSAQQTSKTIPQRCICFIHFQQLQIIFSGGNCSPWRKAGELPTRKCILGRYIPLFDL